jgi:hypothetical protein
MRALLAGILLLLLHLQPLAGAALCERHHRADSRAACEAGTHDAMRTAVPHHSMLNDGATLPMADTCATAMVCATPAPLVAGPALVLDFVTPPLSAALRPRAARPADAPSSQLLRPPII